MFGVLLRGLLEFWRSELQGSASPARGFANPGACLTSGVGTLELIVTLLPGGPRFQMRNACLKHGDNSRGPSSLVVRRRTFPGLGIIPSIRIEAIGVLGLISGR